jgi:hypothetical protein
MMNYSLGNLQGPSTEGKDEEYSARKEFVLQGRGIAGSK